MTLTPFAAPLMGVNKLPGNNLKIFVPDKLTSVCAQSKKSDIYRAFLFLIADMVLYS